MAQLASYQQLLATTQQLQYVVVQYVLASYQLVPSTFQLARQVATGDNKFWGWTHHAGAKALATFQPVVQIQLVEEAAYCTNVQDKTTSRHNMLHIFLLDGIRKHITATTRSKLSRQQQLVHREVLWICTLWFTQKVASSLYYSSLSHDNRKHAKQELYRENGANVYDMDQEEKKILRKCNICSMIVLVYYKEKSDGISIGTWAAIIFGISIGI